MDLWLCGTAENMDGDDSEVERIDPRNVCVVARSRYCIDQWREALNNGLPYGVYQLGRDAENRQRQGIRVATMHRVKRTGIRLCGGSRRERWCMPAEARAAICWHRPGRIKQRSTRKNEASST